MDRLLRFLLVVLVTLGVASAEVRLPEQKVMDCPMSGAGTCPCGMPMPEKGPQPCGVFQTSPVTAPSRTLTAIIEYATTADRVTREPKPWPASWTVATPFEDEKLQRAEPLPVDTGPPLLASEFAARVRIFRI
jgi:hypothetical protein